MPGLVPGAGRADRVDLPVLGPAVGAQPVVRRALVGDPKVLLLDEISMGLAPLIVAELYELVTQIAERGVTILLVEQFVTTAVSVATDAAIMLHGKIHAQGTPEEMGEQALRAYLSGESAS